MKLDPESHGDEPVPARRSKGPHGLGDPNDTFLRKVEQTILIPKIIRDRARTEKCIEEAAAFAKCAKDAGLMLTFRCQDVNNTLRGCLTKWYNDEPFQEECKQRYLQERAEFRRSGLTKKQRAAAQEQLTA